MDDLLLLLAIAFISASIGGFAVLLATSVDLRRAYRRGYTAGTLAAHEKLRASPPMEPRK